MLVQSSPRFDLRHHAPKVKYVPDWMPGAGFKKQAKIWKATAERLVEDQVRNATTREVGELLTWGSQFALVKNAMVIIPLCRCLESEC